MIKIMVILVISNKILGNNIPTTNDFYYDTKILCKN